MPGTVWALMGRQFLSCLGGRTTSCEAQRGSWSNVRWWVLSSARIEHIRARRTSQRLHEASVYFEAPAANLG